MAVTGRILRHGRRQERAAVQPWSDAAADAFETIRRDLRREGRRLRRHADVDDVHDLRVATRRARTLVTLFEDVVDDDELRPVRRELRRLADRLGAVRDLDVMLASLPEREPPAASDGLDPLRRAWEHERDHARRGLLTELGRPRYRRLARRMGRLVEAARAARVEPGEPRLRVRHHAPTRIWASYGRLLAFEIDPATADPLTIHRMRIAAKRLRYTLETFEDALGPDAAPLIERVTALQDLAGEAHDAGVAAARARAVLAGDNIDPHALAAIEAYAADQSRRASDLEPVAERLAAIQGVTFRRTLGRLLAAV